MHDGFRDKTSYVFAMLSDPTGWIDFYVSSNRGSSWTYRRSWQSGPSFTRFFSASSKVGATRGTMFSFVEINDATDLITGADNKYYILYAEWGSSPDTFRLWWLRFPNRSNKQHLLLQGNLYIWTKLLRGCNEQGYRYNDMVFGGV
jgi:hypothetical protein